MVLIFDKILKQNESPELNSSDWNQGLVDTKAWPMSSPLKDVILFNFFLNFLVKIEIKN
jgi:hypothetical protein